MTPEELEFLIDQQEEAYRGDSYFKFIRTTQGCKIRPRSYWRRILITPIRFIQIYFNYQPAWLRFLSYKLTPGPKPPFRIL